MELNDDKTSPTIDNTNRKRGNLPEESSNPNLEKRKTFAEQYTGAKGIRSAPDDSDMETERNNVDSSSSSSSSSSGSSSNSSSTENYRENFNESADNESVTDTQKFIFDLIILIPDENFFLVLLFCTSGMVG